MENFNTQEFDMKNLINTYFFSSLKISLFMGTTDKLIIKEYMSENNINYYSHITKYGSIITIENGSWPIRPFFIFNRHLEVYLPLFYGNVRKRNKY